MFRERKIQGLLLACFPAPFSNSYLLLQPLMLAAWGVALEMAWVEPSWVAHWLKRRRRRKHKKKPWSRSDSLPVPSPLAPPPGRGKLCQRGCVQVRGPSVGGDGLTGLSGVTEKGGGDCWLLSP